MKHPLLQKQALHGSGIDFTDEELEVIDQQLRDSSWANGPLRSDSSFSAPNQLHGTHWGLLDSALGKCPPLPSMVVYRAVPRSMIDPESRDGFESGKAQGGLKPGSSFVDKGYVSTSKNRKVVNHPGYVHKDDRMILRIRIPAGLRGLDVHAVMQHSTNPKAAELASWEEEILLPRGLTFNITKFNEKIQTADVKVSK